MFVWDLSYFTSLVFHSPTKVKMLELIHRSLAKSFQLPKVLFPSRYTKSWWKYLTNMLLFWNIQMPSSLRFSHRVIYCCEIDPATKIMLAAIKKDRYQPLAPYVQSHTPRHMLTHEYTHNLKKRFLKILSKSKWMWKVS